MEIYKLTDDTLGEDRGQSNNDMEGEVNGDGKKNGGNDDGSLSVTELKAGVKNPERVNVYVNGKYTLSLDVAQVVDYKLKIGMVIDEEKLEELKKASEFGKEYQRALEWVLMRPRSEREVRDYLAKRRMTKEAKKRKAGWDRDREIAEAIARGEDATSLQKKAKRIREAGGTKYDFDDLILERLVERGYVDDKRFAEWWVENRNVRKGASQKRLKMELVKKGVGLGIVDEVLGGRNDSDEIEKIIARKRSKYTDEKLIQYLCRQGFSYDLVREKVIEMGEGDDWLI